MKIIFFPLHSLLIRVSKISWVRNSLTLPKYVKQVAIKKKNDKSQQRELLKGNAENEAKISYFHPVSESRLKETLPPTGK